MNTDLIHTPLSPPRAALLCGAVLALVLLPALPASAHDVLVSATPAAGTTVTKLDDVTLLFEDPLVDLGGHKNGIIVTDAAGRHFETACATVSGDDLTIPVALGRSGTYHVQWRGVSPDGHIVGNTYAFTYRPTGSAAAAAGSADGPSCGSMAGQVALETPQQSSPLVPIVIGVVSGVLVLAAVIGVLLVIVRLRRTPGGAA